MSQFLEAGAEDMEISEIFQEIEDGLAQLEEVDIDEEEINERGGFTAICGRTGCRAGVLASPDDPPLITIAMDLADARPLIVGDANAMQVTLEVRSPESNQTRVILCRRAESAQDDTALLYFETSLPLFTPDRLNECIGLIATLFGRTAD